MTHDPLHNLLRQADAAAPAPPPLPPDLPTLIRRRAQHRHRRRILLTATALSFTALLATLILTRTFPPPTPNLVHNIPTPPSPAPQSTPHESLFIDPVADLRDDAACTMVVIARRRAHTLGPADAAEVYQRTIDLYPETHWAAIARTELANLPHRKDPL